MTNKITQKIIGYCVVNNQVEQSTQKQPTIEPSIMHESIKRTDVLDGRTYKIKTPQSEHATYITINHINVNGVVHAYELFINCKNPDHQQWITALTRLISATFRKSGEVRFMTNELLQVCDPTGGHWTKKGANGEKSRFMPSLVAEIGLCLENHFDYIDFLNKCEEIRQDIDKRVKEYNNSIAPTSNEKEKPMPLHEEQPEYPKNAKICPDCKVKAYVLMDGCRVCLSCENSKLGNNAKSIWHDVQ